MVSNRFPTSNDLAAALTTSVKPGLTRQQVDAIVGKAPKYYAPFTRPDEWRGGVKDVAYWVFPRGTFYVGYNENWEVLWGDFEPDAAPSVWKRFRSWLGW
jgi:hypothetical protein